MLFLCVPQIEDLTGEDTSYEIYDKKKIDIFFVFSVLIIRQITLSFKVNKHTFLGLLNIFFAASSAVFAAPLEPRDLYIFLSAGGGLADFFCRGLDNSC